MSGGADLYQTYESGSRQDFLQKCKAGDFDDVVGLYRSNDSTSVTGPFNEELVSVLPKSLKYIAHNGAGYDNIEVSACTERGIRISSTPIAVNDATADSKAPYTIVNAAKANTSKLLSSSCSAPCVKPQIQ